MQLHKLSNILVIILSLSLITLSLENMRRSKSKSHRSHSHRTQKSKSRSRVRQSNAPFNSDNTIQLIQDIGNVILQSGDKPEDKANFTKLFGGCLQFFKDKPDDFATVLQAFWGNCQKTIGPPPTPWDNKYYQAVISALSGKNVLIDSQSKACGTELKLQDNVDASKLTSIMGQNQYLGGFTSGGSYSMPKIDGVISHHRNLLNEGAFQLLNEVSRGGPAVDPSAKTGGGAAPAAAGTPPAAAGTPPAAAGTPPAAAGTPPAAAAGTPPAGAPPAPTAPPASRRRKHRRLRRRLRRRY